MKVINTTIYKCDHCSKKYFKKHAAVNHEKICFHNPENYQPCLNGCKYLEREEVFIDCESHTFKANAFKCGKTNQLMYPLIAKRLNDKYDLEAHDQIQMPLIKCIDYKDFSSLFDI